MSHGSYVHFYELVIYIDQGKDDNQKEAFVVMIEASRLGWLAKSDVLPNQRTYNMRDVPYSLKIISNGFPFFKSGGTFFGPISLFIHSSLAD